MNTYFYAIILSLVAYAGSLEAQRVTLPISSEMVTHEVTFDQEDDLRIDLKGLLPGDFYEVYLVQDAYNPPVTFGNLPSTYAKNSNVYLAGYADAGVISFCLNKEAPKLPGLSIVTVKNQQDRRPAAKVVGDTIEIEENNDIDFLLNTVFRRDTCFALFPGNIRGGRRMRSDGTFLGQTGIFRNGIPTVGIDSGIIVTTGWVQDAVGPNTPTASQNGPVDFFTIMNGVDPDADALVPPNVDIYDLVVLEFDFIPTTDTVSFNYVFFSEQYCANLGGNVANDAFGFLLSGPNGTENIARLPVSNDIVSPATLNPGSPDAAFFLNNTTAGFGDPCMDTPPPPERLAGIGYDGFSTVLTAKGAVVPCAPHTLKIVIVDAEDALSDSGILLEAGSFLAGLVNKPEPNTTAEIGVLQPVEGCDSATIKFTRRTLDEPFINQPLFVKYNVIPYTGPEGEATRATDPGNTAGADYVLPESPFMIPPGDTSATLTIPILADTDFGEGSEAFIIRYDGTCDCTENADTFFIQDNVNFSVDLGMDQTACLGTDINITASPNGGNGTYTYEWPDLSDTSTVTYVATGRDTTITVNVTDGCGLMGTGSVNITAPDFSGSVSGFYSLCADPTADVLVDVTGAGPFNIELRVDASGVVTNTSYQITGDTTFIFEIDADVTIASIEDLSGCNGTVAPDTARIRSANFALTDQVIQPGCNQPSGSIRIFTNDGNNNYAFSWADDPTETTSERTMLLPGVYEVSIAPLNDPTCGRSITYDLSAPPPLSIDTFNYSVPSCAGETITLAPLVSGGATPYAFSWPDSITTDSLLTITTLPGRNVYPVIVTDACGVMTTDSVVLNLPAFNLELSGRYSLCNATSAGVPLTINGPADTYSVELRIDSGGTSRTLILLRPAGTVDLTFDYPASITAISITNGAGCTGDTIAGTAIIVDPELAFSFTLENARCNGEASGSIQLTDQSNLPVLYNWVDIATPTLSRTDLTAGNYDLRITDANDPTCFRDTTFVIAEPGSLTVALSQGNATCPNLPDTLAPQVQGGTPPYTFSWPDSMSTDSLLPITTLPGTTIYQVEVTDACNQTSSAFISYTFEEVNASVSGLYGICNAPFQATVPIIINGSSQYTLTLSENGVNRTLQVTGDTSLVYTSETTIEVIEVLGADGCAGQASGTARVIDTNFMVSGQLTNVTCRGGSDGTIDLTVNGDPAAYNYQWQNPALLGANPTGLPADTFRVRIIDTTPSACFFDTFFVITEPEVLDLSVDATTVNCPGETIEMWPIVTGGTLPYQFNWDNGATVDSVYQLAAVSGTTRYPLVLTDACGVILRDTVTITTSDTRATISGNYSVCNAPFSADVPIQFNGVGPFTFTIRENTVERTLTATADTSLNYIDATTIQLLSVTGRDGCPGQAGGIANVTDATFQVAVNLTEVACQGAATGAIQVEVNGNNAAYQFNWDVAGLSGPDVNGLRAGNYRLTVTDLTPFACTWDTVFTVLEPPSGITLVQDSIRDQTCTQLGYASAAYSGGTGQLTYRWSNGTAGTLLGEVAAGVYTLSVTDENNCQVTQTFNIQDRQSTVLAGISASATTLSCNLSTITLSAQQNVSVVDYLWQDSLGNDLSTNRILPITAPGRYFVRVTNPANGCSAIDSVFIDQSDDLLILDIPAAYAINCNQNAVDLAVMISGNDVPVAYEWFLNGNAVGTTPTLTGVTTTGVYTVEVTRQDNGCTTAAQTEVIINQTPPTVTNPQPVVAVNCRTTEVRINITATGPYQFDWQTTNGALAGATNNVEAIATRAGNYNVIVTDTLNGCTSMASVEVRFEGITLVPDAGTPPTLVCNGRGTALNGNASPNLSGTAYRWYAPDGTSIGNSRQVFTLEAGEHVLEVIHPVSGCSSFDTVMVVSEAPTAVSYSLQQPPCPEVGGRLFVTEVTGRFGPFDFSSPTGETEPFIDGLRGLPVGTNVLVVTDQLGCELRDTFQIFEGITFDGIAEEVVIRLGEEAKLGVQTNRTNGQIASYSWGNLNDTLACLTCPSPTTSPLESFLATVTVVDTNGCILNLRQNVVVQEQNLIYMPTAFSPANQDGVNDVYTVFGNAEFVPAINYLHIYDRWGNRVFTRENFAVNDPIAGWTGAAPDGRPAPSGVYVYVVGYQRWDGITDVVKGDFTLVR